MASFFGAVYEFFNPVPVIPDVPVNAFVPVVLPASPVPVAFVPAFEGRCPTRLAFVPASSCIVTTR